MKQLGPDYLRLLKEWDQTHRLVGNTPSELLYEEAKDSLLELPQEILGRDCLVDVGAGSGLMGMAWLDLSPTHRTIFIEPRKKAYSFLNWARSSLEGVVSRSLVVPLKLEDVSRETVLAFAPENQLFLAARAFSGPVDLDEAHSKSPLSTLPLYSFSPRLADSENSKYCLIPVHKTKK